MSVYKEPSEEIDLVLEKRKNDFLKERETWTKVPDHPEDKKEYTVGCYEEDDWKCEVEEDDCCRKCEEIK